MNPNNYNSKLLLTPAQRNVYLWLKSQKINTQDATLIYWSKRYSEKRLRDVVNFAYERMASGQNIRNIGGWIQTMLAKAAPVVDDQCRANREHVQRFASQVNWRNLKIYEKYVKDQRTGEDISLTISQEAFSYALKNLYERNQTYGKQTRRHLEAPY
jgi:hypothetical protein